MNETIIETIIYNINTLSSFSMLSGQVW